MSDEEIVEEGTYVVSSILAFGESPKHSDEVSLYQII